MSIDPISSAARFSVGQFLVACCIVGGTAGFVGADPGDDAERRVAGNADSGRADRTNSSDAPGSSSASLKPRATLKGHPALVYCVRFTSDGKTLVSSSAPKYDIGRQEIDTVIVWPTAAQGKKKLAIAVDQSVMSLAIAGGGKQVAVPRNNKVSLFDLKSGKEVDAVTGPEMTNAVSVAASEKGDLLAAGFSTGEIIVWQTRGKKVLPARTLRGHSGNVISLAISPDGKRLASGGTDNSARLWDTAAGKTQHVLAMDKPDSPVVGVRFSSDGKSLATLAGEIRFWDPQSGKSQESQIAESDRVGCRAMAFSADGKFLAAGAVNLNDYRQGKVSVWDRMTGKKIAEAIDEDGLVYDLAFSPDGKVLASTGGPTVKLWDLEIE